MSMRFLLSLFLCKRQTIWLTCRKYKHTSTHTIAEISHRKLLSTKWLVGSEFTGISPVDAFCGACEVFSFLAVLRSRGNKDDIADNFFVSQLHLDEQISSVVGYNSLQYFWKTFKYPMSMTPNDYRKQAELA